jgi:hypothetical protein
MNKELDILRDKIEDFDWIHSTLEECKEYFYYLVDIYILKKKQALHKHDCKTKKWSNKAVHLFALESCYKGEEYLRRYY